MSKESVAEADRSGSIAIPNKVFEAAQRGELQDGKFAILLILYCWAEQTTGIARSVSVSRLCDILKEPDEHKVQRQMYALQQAGWFTTNHRAGSRQPYDVNLSDSLAIAGDKQ